MTARLVFFNRVFYPDTSATSQMLSDLAFHFAGIGADVHVVTSAPPDVAVPLEERVRGVAIHRVVLAPASQGLVRRAFAFLAYYLAARRWVRANLAAGDIAIFKTDPPMLGAMVGGAASRRGARVVNWLQDLFPEVAVEYGIPGFRGPLGESLRRLRNRSLRRADRNVSIGERMAEHLAKSVAGPLDVIHNWADGGAIRPVARESNRLRDEWRLRDAFVIEYSGNLGRVHEFETLLEAATHLRGHLDVRFLIVGRGPRLREVKERVAALGLGNFEFKPHQDRELLSLSLGAGDVHLSTLHPRFEGLVHPSKLYGIMAAGRPIVFVGDPDGETARILARSGAGSSVRTGDAQELVRLLLRLRDDPAGREQMGRNARAAFEADYDRPTAYGRWESLLRSLGAITR